MWSFLTSILFLYLAPLSTGLYTHQDPSTFPKIPGVQWVQTTYQDKDELVQLFRGVEVVLSFILAHNDPGNASANSLLDAAIEAGVKRFVPSEWAM